MSYCEESLEHYRQAAKAAHKFHRQCVQRGISPYLQVLDDILPAYTITGETNLGLIEIPISKIVGTKAKGRTNAFAADFMPMLSETSEFGTKWRNLCEAHLSAEGLRDPICCYEFLGKFYVQDGNIRVSVLKYFDALSVPANVIRILPGESSLKDVPAYEDFLSYYPLTKLYEVAFSRPGCFAKLQAALGYDPNHKWTDPERKRFLSHYFFFHKAFQKVCGNDQTVTAADALLEWLNVYPFHQIKEMSEQDLVRSLEAMWSDINATGSKNHIEVLTRDFGSDEKNYKNRRSFSLLPSYLNIAFIHELEPETSNWVHAHEDGSRHLEEVLNDQVIVQRYFGVGVGETAEKAMEIAIKNGAEVLFATTASLITACRRVAARHPETKIFNCSVYMPYSDVRTYYSRIYEGKFISGAIAGALSSSDDIGYIASYPIFGVPAGINAFALGTQLTRPNARIHLKWSCTEGDPIKELTAQNIQIISALDIPQQNCAGGQWGTFQVKADGSTEMVASPYWDWGAFYIQIARSLLSRKYDTAAFATREDCAVNYWWGIASGVVGLTWTENLPEGTKAFANVLKEGIRSGSVDPFLRRIVSQDKVLRNDGHRTFSPEEILRMDWLCDNVYGTIPAFETLSDKGKALTRLQGIYRDRIPPYKACVQI